jgi:hypothetical protein
MKKWRATRYKSNGMPMVTLPGLATRDASKLVAFATGSTFTESSLLNKPDSFRLVRQIGDDTLIVEQDA